MRWIHSVTASYDTEAVLPLDDVKAELDVTHEEDDSLISSHRDSAIGWVEEYVGRFLGPKSVLFIADRLPSSGSLFLPFAPVSAVASVTVGGSVVADYSSVPGALDLLLPPSTAFWPPYTIGMGAVRVSYTAGYAIGSCPPLLIQAAKLMAGVFYDRSDDPERDTEAVRNLIRSSRHGIG